MMTPGERAKDALELYGDTIEVAGALSAIADKLHLLGEFQMEYFCKEARDNLLGMRHVLTTLAKCK